MLRHCLSTALWNHDATAPFTAVCLSNRACPLRCGLSIKFYQILSNWLRRRISTARPVCRPGSARPTRPAAPRPARTTRWSGTQTSTSATSAAAELSTPTHSSRRRRRRRTHALDPHMMGWAGTTKQPCQRVECFEELSRTRPQRRDDGSCEINHFFTPTAHGVSSLLFISVPLQRYLGHNPFRRAWSQPCRLQPVQRRRHFHLLRAVLLRLACQHQQQQTGRKREETRVDSNEREWKDKSESRQ